MDFQVLYERISPRLKRIARYHSGRGYSIDKDDLYQEMCIHLWNNFRYGLPGGINDAYILKGCQFHILNYLRKQREKVVTLSMEEPVDNKGHMLKDVLPAKDENIERYVDRKMTIDYILNNGFSRREKEVFSLLLEGYTTREAGGKLGISHVMVVKLKNRLIKKVTKKV